MSNRVRIFEVEIIENGKYYNIIAAYEVEFLENGEHYNILVPYKEDAEVKNSPKYEEGVIKIWLRKKPNEGYFISTLERVRAIQDEGKTNQDRGHLIAKMFKKYLLTERELINYQRQINNFFGINNGENIRTQNPLSNRNSKEFRGQLFYEQKIQFFLDKLKGEEVYFEIAEGEFDLIIKDNNKKITKLGRRIYIKFVEPKEDSIHVFIPENRTQLSSSDHEGVFARI